MSTPSTITPLLLTNEEAAAFLRQSERQLFELRKRPDFPPPISIGPKNVRHNRLLLEKWVAGLPNADKEEPPGLKRGRTNWRSQRAGEESGTAPAA